MRIGVVKEIKPDESRVALTTAGVVELSRREYEAAGATITDVDTVWNDAEMVLKVKEPLDGEYQRLSPGQILFTYLHLAAAPDLTRGLCESGAVCIAYETVETRDGQIGRASCR